MILVLWTLLLALFANSADTVRRPLYQSAKYKTFFIKQPLDHFSFAVKDTFRQRYLVFDNYWNGMGSPIFFYTGNEGDIVWFYNNTGLMFDWASEFNAMVVFAEHRYYGESLPFGKDSFMGLEHVGYLSSEQALADYVVLIDHIKTTVPGAAASPVVAFGGSYGGMLAAWLRMKYPHAVIGSLASSAPIWLFDHLVPCGLYNELVTRDFNRSGPSCVANIRRSWKVINSMANTESDRATLARVLELCDSLPSSSAVADLKDWLSDTWINLAMVDYPYPASFLETLPAWPIKVVCSHLSEVELTDMKLLQKLHDALNVYYNYTGSTACFNVSQTAHRSLGEKGWDFQSCTEMVMPICSDGVNDMFESDPWNLTQFTADCHKKWSVVPRPRWVVKQYGGKNISSATNIIFSNGDLDPWSVGGVLDSPSPSLVAIMIKDAAHHLDLRGSHPDDTAAMVAARLREKAIIKRWLWQYWHHPQPPTEQPDDLSLRLVSTTQLETEDLGASYVRRRSREPSLRDEILVFVVMAVMFISLLIIVNFTRSRPRRQLNLTFDEIPLYI